MMKIYSPRDAAAKALGAEEVVVALRAEAARRGVLVACSGTFTALRKHGRFVRACIYGNNSETKLVRGLTILQQMGARPA